MNKLKINGNVLTQNRLVILKDWNRRTHWFTHHESMQQWSFVSSFTTTTTSVYSCCFFPKNVFLSSTSHDFVFFLDCRGSKILHDDSFRSENKNAKSTKATYSLNPEKTNSIPGKHDHYAVPEIPRHAVIYSLMLCACTSCTTASWFTRKINITTC